MKIAIRYFTGTGNTLHVCYIAAREFEKSGWAVDTQEIKAAGQGTDMGLETADLVLVAFPVLGFSPPKPVIRWIARMPKQKGQKAATLAVGGATYLGDRYIPGWGADAPFSAARALRRKGRLIIGIGETSMPDNFTQVTNPPDTRQCGAIRERNNTDTTAYARELIQAAERGEAKALLKRGKRVRVPFMLIAFFFRHFGRPTLSRTYISDDSCTGCGLCARQCPARAIKLRRGQPTWSLKCVACNRCINICPTASIQTSSVALALHLLLAIVSFAAALSLPLPRELLVPARAAVRILMLIAFFVFQIGPFSLLLKNLMQRAPLRKAFTLSFTKKFRRYKADELRID